MSEPTIRRGIVVYQYVSVWNGALTTRTDTVEIHTVPWDYCRFDRYTRDGTWRKRDTYDSTAADFPGHVSNVNGPMVGYHVDSECCGRFVDEKGYRRFLSETMRAVVLEELWDDHPVEVSP